MKNIKKINIIYISIFALIIIVILFKLNIKPKADTVSIQTGDVVGRVAGELDYSKSPRIVIGDRANLINSDGTYTVSQLLVGPYTVSIWDDENEYTLGNSRGEVFVSTGETATLDIKNIKKVN